MPKRRRGEPGNDGGWQSRRLYLIFDDWPWGYSIRELLLPRHQDPAANSGGAPAPRRGQRLPLPRPFIRVEAPRGYSLFFAAVGTRIVATHLQNTWSDDDAVPDDFLPIVHVRSRGVTFGPGGVRQNLPIYLPVGGGGAGEFFSLDTLTVRMLSFKPLWPPRLEHPSPRGIDDDKWAWRQLPERPPFDRMDVNSYAVHPDDSTVIFSTDHEGTFAFDTAKFDGSAVQQITFAGPWWLSATEKEQDLDVPWTRLGEWSLPFAGRAHYVPCMDTFVGLSNDPAALGHLCSCSFDGGGPPASLKLGKDKLFSEDPAETHVGATLLHFGGSEFCLVQSVSIAHGHADKLGGAHGGRRR